MTSSRANSGFQTKGTKIANIGSEELESNSLDNFDAYRQGYNVVDDNYLTSHVTYKIRSNSGRTRTFAGRDINVKVYDDTLSPTAIENTDPTGVISNSMPALDGDAKVSERMNHITEQRDLGQTLLYEIRMDGIFLEQEDPDNPVVIIQKGSNNQFVTSELQDHSSPQSLDGILEPLLCRTSIDSARRKNVPLNQGMRTSIGIGVDSFGRSFMLEAGYDVPKDESRVYDLSSHYFVDEGKSLGPIFMLPEFVPDRRKLFPFRDTFNDAEAYYRKTYIDADIVEVISRNLMLDDDNVAKWDIMGSTGYRREDNRNVDSVIYGGLVRS